MSCRATTRGWLGFDALHQPGKGIAQAFDDLEQREIRIGEAPAKEEALAGGMARQHPLEIAQELGHAVLQENLRALLGGPALLLVIELGRDRVMGVMHLLHQIGDRELELMGEEPDRPSLAGASP